MKKYKKLTENEVLSMTEMALRIKESHPDAFVLGGNVSFGVCEYFGSADEELRPYEEYDLEFVHCLDILKIRN